MKKYFKQIIAIVEVLALTVVMLGGITFINAKETLAGETVELELNSSTIVQSEGSDVICNFTAPKDGTYYFCTEGLREYDVDSIITELYVNGLYYDGGGIGVEAELKENDQCEYVVSNGDIEFDFVVFVCDESKASEHISYVIGGDDIYMASGESRNLSIEIYNLIGDELQELPEGYSIEWTGENFGSSQLSYTIENIKFGENEESKSFYCRIYYLGVEVFEKDFDIHNKDLYFKVESSKDCYAKLGSSITLKPTITDYYGNEIEIDESEIYIEWYKRIPGEYAFEYVGEGRSYVINSVQENDFCTDENYVYYMCEIVYRGEELDQYFYIYENENPIDSVELISGDISIKEYTHGYFAYYNNEFEYSLDEILKDNPVLLRITYQNKNKKTIELSSVDYEGIDDIFVNWYYAGGEPSYNLIVIDVMGHTVYVPVEIGENSKFDPVVSGKLVELPEQKDIYPLNTHYDYRDVKIELTYKSGETEIVGFNNDLWKVNLKDYDATYNFTDYLYEGKNDINISICGLKIPITTITATKQIVKYRILTMPTNVYGEGATVELTYDDGTTEEVLIDDFIGSKGFSEVYESGNIYTNAGFSIGWAYSLNSFGQAKLAYGTSVYDINQGDYTTLEFDGIEYKMIAAIALHEFVNNVEYKGTQTDNNIDQLLMSAMTYYVYGDAMYNGIDLSVAEENIKKMYNVDTVDLTKSAYYDASKNMLVGKVYFKCAMDVLFSDNLKVYEDESNSIVYKYTKDNNTTYIEIQKTDKKVAYIGSDYGTSNNVETPITNQDKPQVEQTTSSTSSIKIKTAKIKSAEKKKSAKKAKINLKKIKDVDGYEIKISTTKKFKKKNTITKTSAKNTVTVKKLRANKKYFVKARCYKVVSGKKRFGDWSKVKKVKMK